MYAEQIESVAAKIEMEDGLGPVKPVVVCEPVLAVKIEMEDELGPAKPVVVCEPVLVKVEMWDELGSAEPVGVIGEEIVVKVEASMVEEIDLVQPRIGAEHGNECEHNGVELGSAEPGIPEDATMDGNEQVCSRVEIEGEAVCETHDHSNCLDCNHTAPGPREITVMEAKVENNVPGVRMDSTCNHSSPRTEGIQISTLIIPLDQNGLFPTMRWLTVILKLRLEGITTILCVRLEPQAWIHPQLPQSRVQLLGGPVPRKVWRPLK